ncbi:phosphatase PAP2 family protein [Paenibacillus sp. 481]|uniref:phosphatase PAP2 family protein n=1 Tax=Paenibacillus sp. 481 TaxID=2835869 RepID=UPI001E2D88C9|nr:phosphatase PAP2 family protein [Paenibacillus sp. 481]UHA72243.1 phosphatase PAP2 family protein [Paenibacillus sp. 481]
MTRVIAWLGHQERQLFVWINHRMHHRKLNLVLYPITHLGGATFTITFTLMLALFAPAPWETIGWQCLIALSLSHVPVAVIKRLYPRIRPHLALPNIYTFRKPLMDHSFPSGHTTAVCSVAVPLMIANPVLIWLLLPVTSIVAVSRMYLGLHYPSDCLAGAFIGAGTAVSIVALWT